MRIVQITDIHIGYEDEDTFGVDVRSNFLKVLEEVRKLHPDHLVISGDLCYETGQRPIYQWIKTQLNELNLEYDLISGNHDDPQMLAEVFEREGFLQDGQLYFRKKIGHRTILFLDTTTGIVTQKQLNWLKLQLEATEGELTIFMHHPPIMAGVPFMDGKYALQNMEEVQEVLFTYPDSINIFTGHYHVEKTIRKKNIVVHITPSCFFQIDQHSEEFKVDHHRIGFREIMLNGSVSMHTVRYI